MRKMALTPNIWRNADWALEKGLYDEVLPTIEEMDIEIHKFTKKLNSYNPKALTALKSTFWEGTKDWDELLIQRAQISGELVLSDFTKTAIEQFNSK